MTSADIFNPDLYREVRDDLLEAQTLPGWCYTDPRFFNREQERIFDRCWHFVGREDEIPAAGDYLTYESLQGSVIVIRSESGELKAFRNACRHRGTRLLERSGSALKIICPYHSWVYSADGQLLRAPGMQEARAFSVENCSLAALSLESWAGFIFIRYHEGGPSLLEQLGDLPDTFRAYTPERFRCVRRRKFDVNCNWKFLIENALEAYHTGTVHRASLGRQQSEALTTQGGWLGLRVFVDGRSSVSVLSQAGDVFPSHPGLTAEQSASTYFTNLMPCTQFVFAPDAIWWLAMRPVRVDCTRLEVGSCFHLDVLARDDFEETVQAYFARWDTATPEDNAICEAQHRGNQSHPHNRGRFGAEEGLVHQMANWVLDQVL